MMKLTLSIGIVAVFALCGCDQVRVTDVVQVGGIVFGYRAECGNANAGGAGRNMKLGHMHHLA